MCFRPVTLLGFSLGARVIFRCLQCLSESDNNGIFSKQQAGFLFTSMELSGENKTVLSAGLIERVVLLGSPIAIQDENWETARKV